MRVGVLNIADVDLWSGHYNVVIDRAKSNATG